MRRARLAVEHAALAEARGRRAGDRGLEAPLEEPLLLGLREQLVQARGLRLGALRVAAVGRDELLLDLELDDRIRRGQDLEGLSPPRGLAAGSAKGRLERRRARRRLEVEADEGEPRPRGDAGEERERLAAP
ncbi:MAG: hypothetical protein M0D55_00970 [Elusimicrobiota bacterium]|nr:MAG: hypothetical protein M0D55_00970 [Elusimicrobiota bacterium]